MTAPVSTATFEDSEIGSIAARARDEYGDYATVIAQDATVGASRDIEMDDQVIEPTDLVLVNAGRTLVAGTDYILDSRNGRIVLTSMPTDPVVHITGTAWQFFTKADLARFASSALAKHTNDRVLQAYSTDPAGFREYAYVRQTLATLPYVEWHLVSILTAIEALWVLVADSAYDIDVSTAAGTSIPRTERTKALTTRITELQKRYDTLGRQLNVGLGRISEGVLRRTSRTFEALVPLYTRREYDDRALPMRQRPPVDTPAATVASSTSSTVQEYSPVVTAGIAWTSTVYITDAGDLTVPGTVLLATITTGGYISGLVPITVSVAGPTQLTLSLTDLQTKALPPYASWRLQVGGRTRLAGTFLVEAQP